MFPLQVNAYFSKASFNASVPGSTNLPFSIIVIFSPYFGCHTDITIPYEELLDISAYTKDGEKITIIENGRFVLPGTEALNEAFEK